MKTFEPNWLEWERLIRENGITIDRPRGSIHPVHSEIVYHIDYGYINETLSSDGEEVDVFVGSTEAGLVGAILTTDFRKKDREYKFLVNCSRSEVYLVNGFINFDQTLMSGQLVLMVQMNELAA